MLKTNYVDTNLTEILWIKNFSTGITNLSIIKWTLSWVGSELLIIKDRILFVKRSEILLFYNGGASYRTTKLFGTIDYSKLSPAFDIALGIRL